MTHIVDVAHAVGLEYGIYITTNAIEVVLPVPTTDEDMISVISGMIIKFSYLINFLTITQCLSFIKSSNIFSVIDKFSYSYYFINY